MRQYGSQLRESLEDSGYSLLARNGKDVLLQQFDYAEVWTQNNHAAGYVVEIDGIGYKFVRSIPPLSGSVI